MKIFVVATLEAHDGVTELFLDHLAKHKERSGIGIVISSTVFNPKAASIADYYISTPDTPRGYRMNLAIRSLADEQFDFITICKDNYFYCNDHFDIMDGLLVDNPSVCSFDSVISYDQGDVMCWNDSGSASGVYLSHQFLDDVGFHLFDNHGKGGFEVTILRRASSLEVDIARVQRATHGLMDVVFLPGKGSVLNQEHTVELNSSFIINEHFSEGAFAYDNERENIKLLNHESKSVRIRVSDENDHIQKVWMKGKFYEIAMLEKMAEVCEGRFIDCGAHMGNHSLFMAGIHGYTTVSIEPDPINFEQLSYNLTQLNGLDVDTINKGLSSKKEMLYLVRTEGNTGMSRLSNKTGADKIELQCVTLDSIVNERGYGNISVIKIDTEQMEQSVIMGARSIIGRDKPHLFIETDTPDRVLELLREFHPGYQMMKKYNRTPTYHFQP